MQLLYKAKPLKPGYNRIVSPANAPLKYLEFGRVWLRTGEHWALATGTQEAALEIMAGVCTVAVTGRTVEPVTFERVGGRKDIFDGRPTTIYLPRGVRATITAEGPELHLAVFKAPARRDTRPRCIAPDEVFQAVVGKLTWTREVITTVGPNMEADRLLVGETWNRPGCWSSYPPHKHDTDRAPAEAWYEEVYFFQVRPRQGFGLQRVYTPREARSAFDEALVIEDGDTVVLPAGYHPVVAAPGYRLWYCWGLAGEGRQYAAWSDDPAHAWLRAVEAMV